MAPNPITNRKSAWENKATPYVIAIQTEPSIMAVNQDENRLMISHLLAKTKKYQIYTNKFI